jgi:DNA-binding MarR family transcriptional regulator
LTPDLVRSPVRPGVEQVVDELAPLMSGRHRGLAERCRRHALSMMHLYVLGVLEESAAVPMSRLAEKLDVSVSSTTGIVTRMEERGLVERVHDRDDRRVVLVRLTPEGQRMVRSVESAGRDRLATILGELEADELVRVLDAARLFSAAVRRHAAARGSSAHDGPLVKHMAAPAKQ